MAKLTPNIFEASSSFEFSDVLAATERKGYQVRARGDFDMNVTGVRRTPIRVNEFNDVLFAFYPLNGQWQYQKFQITTLPGYTFLHERLGNEKGTAILVPDQYRDKYCVRRHDGRYQALCEKEDRGIYVKVWRDDSLDGLANPDKNHTFNAKGINIHHAEPEGCTVTIDSYSSGCQVFRCIAQFDAFMALVRRSRDTWKNSFTYTLLDEADL